MFIPPHVLHAGEEIWHPSTWKRLRKRYPHSSIFSEIAENIDRAIPYLRVQRKSKKIGSSNRGEANRDLYYGISAESTREKS